MPRFIDKETFAKELLKIKKWNDNIKILAVDEDGGMYGFKGEIEKIQTFAGFIWGYTQEYIKEGAINVDLIKRVIGTDSPFNMDAWIFKYEDDKRNASIGKYLKEEIDILEKELLKNKEEYEELKSGTHRYVHRSRILDLDSNIRLIERDIDAKNKIYLRWREENKEENDNFNIKQGDEKK